MRKILLIIIIFNMVYMAGAQEYTVKKINLGPSVNTTFDEFAPVITPDGKTLYFCREGDTSNLGYKEWPDDQDIWYSTLQPNGTWSKAVNIGPPLNNTYPNSVRSVTPDGNTMLLFGAYNPDSTVSAGISISHRTKNGWTFPVNQKIKNYYNKSTYSSYYLANDGKTLILSIERDDSFGDRDLYVSFLQDDREWSEPMNLGDVINTDKKESSPFLAADGKTLYFSSLGHGGFGGEDLFFSTRLDDTWKNWSKPQNLGGNINTAGKDYYYIIPAKADVAYFVSTENSIGGRDIFKLQPEEVYKPEPVVMIYGKVLNKKTKEPIQASVIYEILPEGNEAGRASSKPVTGEYKITLPPGSNYGFRAEADGFMPVNDHIDLKNIKEYTEIERNLELVPIEKGEVVRLNNIFFDYDKATLKEESFPELNRVVKFLNDNPNVEIEIDGHTDSRGSDEYNLALSENRSKSVADYLVSKGISQDRLTYKGYGESRPLADNETDEGREMNRRVEFRIMKK